MSMFNFRGSQPICENREILHHAKISRYTVIEWGNIDTKVDVCLWMPLYVCMWEYRNVIDCFATFATCHLV